MVKHPNSVIPAKAGIQRLFATLGPRWSLPSNAFIGSGDDDLRHRLERLVCIALAVLCIGGCGFHLRSPAQLPFQTIYIPGNSPLALELKRNLAAASNTRVVNDPKQAEASLGFTTEARNKVILSFNTAGQVAEYRLRYQVGFRVTDPRGQVFLPTSEIVLTRDISFNNAQVLAKESEEAQLYRDMQSDMVQQILRRIAAAKPAKPEVVE